MKLPVIIVRVFQTTGVSQGPEQGQSESPHISISCLISGPYSSKGQEGLSGEQCEAGKSSESHSY